MSEGEKDIIGKRADDLADISVKIIGMEEAEAKKAVEEAGGKFIIEIKDGVVWNAWARDWSGRQGVVSVNVEGGKVKATEVG